jgi:protein transport protein SEC23
LLRAPQEDAKLLVESRFPHPLFIDCDQGSSQARFVLAQLDPASTHLTQTPSLLGTQRPDQTQEIIFSEDVSLQVFMEVLRKKAAETEVS